MLSVIVTISVIAYLNTLPKPVFEKTILGWRYRIIISVLDNFHQHEEVNYGVLLHQLIMVYNVHAFFLEYSLSIGERCF